MMNIIVNDFQNKDKKERNEKQKTYTSIKMNFMGKPSFFPIAAMVRGSQNAGGGRAALGGGAMVACAAGLCRR